MKKKNNKGKAQGIDLKEGVIFILHEGRLLHLEKRLEADSELFGYTIIPGGGIEDGETVIEALEREVKEEFDVRITGYEKLGIIEYPEKGKHIYHVFKVFEWKGEPANPEALNEHLEATFETARIMCLHPLSQLILDLFEKSLFVNSAGVSANLRG